MKSNAPVQHACDFLTLLSAAISLGEMERLAGVCDREITWRAASRALNCRVTQWEKFMLVLKRRIRLRYDRGELLAAERRALAKWCGEKIGEVA